LGGSYAIAEVSGDLYEIETEKVRPRENSKAIRAEGEDRDVNSRDNGGEHWTGQKKKCSMGKSIAT